MLQNQLLYSQQNLHRMINLQSDMIWGPMHLDP